MPSSTAYGTSKSATTWRRFPNGSPSTSRASTHVFGYLSGTAGARIVEAGGFLVLLELLRGKIFLLELDDFREAGQVEDAVSAHRMCLRALGKLVPRRIAA